MQSIFFNEDNGSRIKQIGTGVTIVGMGSLFLLAVSASVTLDILILMALLSNKNNNNNNQRQAFLTGYLLGTMQNRNYNTSNQHTAKLDFGDMNLYQSAGVMSLATAPAIGITAGLSKYYFDRTDVCNGFLIAWGVASGLVVVGLIMHTVGHTVERRSKDGVSSVPATLYLAAYPNQSTASGLPVASQVQDAPSTNAFVV